MTGLFIGGRARASLPCSGSSAGAHLPWTKMAPVATAVLLGLAGYAWQAHPGLVGHDDETVSGRQVRRASCREAPPIGERLAWPRAG